MIVDKLQNIEIYKKLPKSVVSFIKSLDNNIETGRHEISDGIYANVEVYDTKPVTAGKFEAHRTYIDVQLLLSGEEYIYVDDVRLMTAGVQYSQEKDIEFYSNPVKGNRVKLDGSNFVVLFPHEAHAPQISVAESSSSVLKVVVKIRI